MNALSKSFYFLFIVVLMACSEKDEPVSTGDSMMSLAVYKTPTCGCCKKWVSHLKESGFSTKTHDQSSIEDVKQKHQIPANLRSCHTGISQQGYFFEGHIPAKYIAQFLAAPPENALGLAVPGMPAGSPGMEMGDRFNPYRIYVVYKDQRTEVFASVDSMEAQK